MLSLLPHLLPDLLELPQLLAQLILALLSVHVEVKELFRVDVHVLGKLAQRSGLVFAESLSLLLLLLLLLCGFLGRGGRLILVMSRNDTDKSLSG